MLKRIALFSIASCALACAHAAPQPGSLCIASTADAELVDLSHAFDRDTLYWPTDTAGFQLNTLSEGHTEGGYYYSAYAYAGAEHGGTHIDAPLHFAEGGASTDAIPLARLTGPGVVIDIQADAASDADALLTPEHIRAFEAAHGTIARGSIVLVRSGWSKRWPQRRAYLGDDTAGDASQLHFPGLSEAAARALVARQVAAVGIDTASIDHGPSRDFIVHRVLLGAGVPAFENLTALERLPERGAWIVALPMKIARGSGGPLRALAIVPSGAGR